MTNDAEILDRLAALREQRSTLEAELASNRAARYAARQAAGRTESDLVWADAAKCPCGALLAYDRDVPLSDGAWDCSAILLGTAVQTGKPGAVEHTDRLPFAFYDVRARRT